MHTFLTLLTCLRAEYANHQKFKRQFPLHTVMDWFGVCYGQFSIIHTRVFVALGHLSRNTKCILCVSEENCLHKCSTTSQIRALQLRVILEVVRRQVWWKVLQQNLNHGKLRQEICIQLGLIHILQTHSCLRLCWWVEQCNKFKN